MPSPDQLQRELNDLQAPYELLAEKLSRLRRDHAIETDTANRFKLEKQIEQAEAEQEKIKARLEALEQALAAASRQATEARPPARIESAPPGSPHPTPDTGPLATSPRLPQLEEALRRRRLVFFIGADVPPAVTGLPARADLARELARRQGLDDTLSLAEVAQRVSQAGNRWVFTDFLRTALDTGGQAPQAFHRHLARLVKENALETIITTAYDNLLELAFQQVGLALNRVVRGSDLNFINPDRPTLLKLYGDLQQPETLVVTERDHSDLLRDRAKEALVDEVRRAFHHHTVLFLGYNLADPDFRFLFDQIAQNRFAPTAYAVWPGLPPADVQMWRDRGIVILESDPFGVWL